MRVWGLGTRQFGLVSLWSKRQHAEDGGAEMLISLVSVDKLSQHSGPGLLYLQTSCHVDNYASSLLKPLLGICTLIHTYTLFVYRRMLRVWTLSLFFTPADLQFFGQIKRVSQEGKEIYLSRSLSTLLERKKKTKKHSRQLLSFPKSRSAAFTCRRQLSSKQNKIHPSFLINTISNLK